MGEQTWDGGLYKTKTVYSGSYKQCYIVLQVATELGMTDFSVSKVGCMVGNVLKGELEEQMKYN